jgi:hypothetical protein
MKFFNPSTYELRTIQYLQVEGEENRKRNPRVSWVWGFKTKKKKKKKKKKAKKTKKKKQTSHKKKKKKVREALQAKRKTVQ